MKKTCLLNLIVVVAIAMSNISTAVAQNDVAKLVSAIEKMESSDQIIFSGVAETPKAEGAGAMGGARVIVVGGGGQDSKLFNNRFELKFSPQEGDLLICSEEKLPGIAIYQVEEQTISSTTFSDEQFAIEDLGNDLPQILDTDNLKKYISKVEKCEITENDGITSYSCGLPKRFIRNLDDAGPRAILAANIKGVEAKFQVDGDGELAEIFIEVTRENPIAKMMGMGGAMKMRGGNLDALDPAMKAQVESQLGGSDIVVEYRLKRESKASTRTQEVLEEMRSLIVQ